VPARSSNRPAPTLLLGAALAAVLGGCMSANLPTLAGERERPAGVRPALTLPEPPANGYDLDKPYPLLPGDTIEVVVLEDAELGQTYPIPADGMIEVWRSEREPGQSRETVNARGCVPAELAELIATAYTKHLFKHKPYVQVRVASAVPRLVYMTGAVKLPQPLPLPPVGRMTLYRALQASGGRAEDSDWSRVRISRRDAATGAEVSLPEFDLDEMEEYQAFDRDPPLEPNDIIHVPRLGFVTIFGKVNQPGQYLCKKRMRLVDLIGVAGGLQQFAKRSDIRVIRSEGAAGEKVYTVNLDAIFAGRAADPRMQAEDRVEVDEDWK
jgi:protein involved in polysaccharide export with SLBB domain